MRQSGEMGKPARDRSLVGGAEHLFRNGGAPARGRLPAVEYAVIHPACGDMRIAAGVGAGRMTGNDVVDFEPILDFADALFEAAVGCHLLTPIRIDERFDAPSP